MTLANNRDFDIGAKGNFSRDTANVSLMTQLNIPSDNTLTFFFWILREIYHAITILLVSIATHLRFYLESTLTALKPPCHSHPLMFCTMGWNSSITSNQKESLNNQNITKYFTIYHGFV